MQPLLTAPCDLRNLYITKTFFCTSPPLSWLFFFPSLPSTDKATEVLIGSMSVNCHVFLPAKWLQTVFPCTNGLHRTNTQVVGWNFKPYWETVMNILHTDNLSLCYTRSISEFILLYIYCSKLSIGYFLNMVCNAIRRTSLLGTDTPVVAAKVGLKHANVHLHLYCKHMCWENT